MISTKHIAFCTVLATLCASSVALANETYACSHGDMKREITVAYETADSTVPCEVTYTKEDGSTQSLWQAQSETGYCEGKAEAFVEKQRGWGWECAKQ